MVTWIAIKAAEAMSNEHIINACQSRVFCIHWGQNVRYNLGGKLSSQDYGAIFMLRFSKKLSIPSAEALVNLIPHVNECLWNSHLPLFWCFRSLDAQRLVIFTIRGIMLLGLCLTVCILFVLYVVETLPNTATIVWWSKDATRMNLERPQSSPRAKPPKWGR